jgi:hypothetical protein
MPKGEKMRRETIKEIGKFMVDIAKVIFAIALLAPLVQKGEFSILPAISGLIFAGGGFFLVDKGASDG